jgi:hypothetical protein
MTGIYLKCDFCGKTLGGEGVTKEPHGNADGLALSPEKAILTYVQSALQISTKKQKTLLTIRINRQRKPRIISQNVIDIGATVGQQG